MPLSENMLIEKRTLSLHNKLVAQTESASISYHKMEMENCLI